MTTSCIRSRSCSPNFATGNKSSGRIFSRYGSCLVISRRFCGTWPRRRRATLKTTRPAANASRGALGGMAWHFDFNKSMPPRLQHRGPVLYYQGTRPNSESARRGNALRPWPVPELYPACDGRGRVSCWCATALVFLADNRNEASRPAFYLNRHVPAWSAALLSRAEA